MTPPSSGFRRRVAVRVAARPGLDGLPSAHVLHAERRDDRLQLLRMNRVVVVLRPAGLPARHEVPAVEVEDERARPVAFRHAIPVRHDAEHAEAAVLLDERHRVGVRREQHLLVLRRAVVLPGQVGDDRLARVALKTRAKRERCRLPRLRVGQHLRAIDAIERQRRAVDVGRAKTGASVLGVDAALHEAESHPWRQVVDDDDAGGLSLDADVRKPVYLAPPQRPLKRRSIRERWRHEQLRPLAGRTPLVVGRRVVIEEVVVVGRRRLLLALEDQDLTGDVRPAGGCAGS